MKINFKYLYLKINFYSIIMNPIENNLEITKKERIKETRKKWNEANKEKITEYARNYYHSRCDKDPNYKIKMCEKEKINKKKREPTERNVGRPRLYNNNIKIEVVNK